MAPEDLIPDARDWEQTARRRTTRELVTNAMIALFFGWMAIRTPDAALMLGAITGLAGAVVASVWAWLNRLPQAPHAADRLTVYRRLLEHQRGALRRAATWEVLPLIPGPAIVVIGLALVSAEVGLGTGMPVGIGIIGIAGLTWVTRTLIKARLDLQAEVEARLGTLDDVLSGDA